MVLRLTNPILNDVSDRPTRKLGLPQARGTADDTAYDTRLTLHRRLAVDASVPWWVPVPVGRLLLLEDFTFPSIANWGALFGARAYDGSQGHARTGAMKLTTGAVAGNQATAERFLPLPADQAASSVANIILGCWFNPVSDANWGHFDVVLDLDDTLQRRLGVLRFLRRDVGLQNKVQYFDSAGIPQDLGVAPISDTMWWHLLVLELAYLQGAGAAGYLRYVSARFDDHRYAFPAGVEGQAIATTGLERGAIQLGTVTTAAVAVNVYTTSIFVADNSQSMGV